MALNTADPLYPTLLNIYPREFLKESGITASPEAAKSRLKHFCPTSLSVEPLVGVS